MSAPPGTPQFAASGRRLAAAAGCDHVIGAFVFSKFQFTSLTTAVGEGAVQGDLAGAFHAQYFAIQPRGEGVLQLRGRHTITRSTGTITTSDDILLLPDQDPAVARVNSRLYVIDGTGAYAGATGLLHTHGEVNLATLAGSIQFKGQVCVR